MNCERCQQNPATEVIQAEKNGRPCECFVCTTCAQEAKAPSGAAGISLADILFSLGMPPNTAADEGALSSRETGNLRTETAAVCPACGMTRGALREHRRFGCPECYQTFADEVALFLQELQFGDVHLGKKPVKVQVHHLLAERRSELEDAVKRQDFDKAAELRDTIQEIERGLHTFRKTSDGQA